MQSSTTNSRLNRNGSSCSASLSHNGSSLMSSNGSWIFSRQVSFKRCGTELKSLPAKILKFIENEAKYPAQLGVQRRPSREFKSSLRAVPEMSELLKTDSSLGVEGK
mmetsp:Transcript_565/g.1674  ORF Transcript_565/g.1674 Transcript_565/m.1674 type:complete len:107 (-) Transcript_565:102-422(-)